MNTAGYSKTPLAQKLGIKKGFNIKTVNALSHYFNLLLDLPEDIEEVKDDQIPKDFIHYLTNEKNSLTKNIKKLKKELKQNGSIWISWPKKASKVETDLEGNIFREFGLKNGLVDIKVFAVDETWSGLKFVIPGKNRK